MQLVQVTFILTHVAFMYYKYSKYVHRKCTYTHIHIPVVLTARGGWGACMDDTKWAGREAWMRCSACGSDTRCSACGSDMHA